MKVIVCGGRDFGATLDNSKEAQELAANQRHSLEEILDLLFGHQDTFTLIHGAARGADVYAEMWAEDSGFKIIEVPADWNKHGKAAGAIRNKEMLNLEPDLVVAFPGGKGTENMIYQAKQAGVPVVRVEI